MNLTHSSSPLPFELDAVIVIPDVWVSGIVLCRVPRLAWFPFFRIAKINIREITFVIQWRVL